MMLLPPDCKTPVLCDRSGRLLNTDLVDCVCQRAYPSCKSGCSYSTFFCFDYVRILISREMLCSLSWTSPTLDNIDRISTLFHKHHYIQASVISSK
jgi:hypothetical protein